MRVSDGTGGGEDGFTHSDHHNSAIEMHTAQVSECNPQQSEVADNSERTNSNSKHSVMGCLASTLSSLMWKCL